MNTDIGNAMRIISEWMKAKNVNAELNLSGIGLKQLPPVPPGVKKLNISNNDLTELRLLPPSLEELNCSNNKISKISFLPPKLKVLNCSNNALAVYPNVGEAPNKYFMRLITSK